jgi:hypothetical protein
MNQCERPKAVSMSAHRCGDTDRLVVSRKMRAARGRYQGRAKRSRPRCSACAIWLLRAVWL